MTQLSNLFNEKMQSDPGTRRPLAIAHSGMFYRVASQTENALEENIPAEGP